MFAKGIVVHRYTEWQTGHGAFLVGLVVGDGQESSKGLLESLRLTEPRAFHRISKN